MAKRRTAANAQPSPSALDQLLAAERELAVRNATVAAECAAIVADARAASIAAATEAERLLALELAALDEKAAQELRAAVEKVRDGTVRTLARYQRLTDAEVTQIADDIATRVTGLTLHAGKGAQS